LTAEGLKMRWMMSCRQASRLTTEASYRALGPLERGLLVFHRSMCGNCRRFAAQMALIDHALREWRDQNGGQRAPR
jgi:hypothetical protein